MLNTQTRPIAPDILQIGLAARAAAADLARLDGTFRTQGLLAAATAMREQSAAILAANAADLAAGSHLSPAMQDRLRLDESRVAAIAQSLETIAAQSDPVGTILAAWTRPNGLKIQRVRVPLGVVGIIYESRPNVTAESAAICLRSGNAAILRSGSDCLRSSLAMAAAIRQGLREAGAPENAVQLIPTTDRAAVGAMLAMKDHIDVIVPRGGRELIERVEAESKIPLLRQYEGICHVYLDRVADTEIARKVTLNAKLRRVSICGAAECLLIDRPVLESIGKSVVQALLDQGCAIRGDEDIRRLDPRVTPASAADWGHEFLAPIMAAHVVDGVEEAIAWINRHGSHHTDSIVTQDQATAEKFLAEIDSGIVMHNASTQFADGGEFGFGGEIGIATGKLHARGPIGAEQLTTFKYRVLGNGQIRP